MLVYTEIGAAHWIIEITLKRFMWITIALNFANLHKGFMCVMPTANPCLILPKSYIYGGGTGKSPIGSGLKLYPAQTAEKAIRLAAIQPAAECAAISAKEPLVMFAQAACKIIVRLLHQERDGC
jgi:hypothetical protein